MIWHGGVECDMAWRCGMRYGMEVWNEIWHGGAVQVNVGSFKIKITI